MSICARALDGILLLDKPAGLTSNAALQRVKRLFRAKKAGHTGSLDPLATGMLPICFGEATKFCQYVLDADKCYETTGLLGVVTNTGDAMGTVISRVEHFSCPEDALLAVIPQFTGAIQQIPPMYSALKHHGKPLYAYARAGVTLERSPRLITIHDLQVCAFDGRTMDLRVRCSKGTYIRSLVESIGETLGMGAHVTRLRRCYTAGFEQDPMFTLDALVQMSEEHLDACLLPMERTVSHLPCLVLEPDRVKKLRNGQVIDDCVASSLIGSVRLHDETAHFIGLGDLLSDGKLLAKRLLQMH